jgi:hypothetical protein
MEYNKHRIIHRNRASQNYRFKIEGILHPEDKITLKIYDEDENHPMLDLVMQGDDIGDKLDRHFVFSETAGKRRIIFSPNITVRELIV